MRRLTFRGDDRGIALPAVMILGLVLTVLVATGLTAATGGLRLASTDQDATGAYDAAMAGVQEYVTRIDADASYSGYGAATAAFSAGSTLSAPPTANPAFGLGSAGTWATVPDGTTTSVTCPNPPGRTPCFRYEVDDRAIASGILRIRSTGRVGAEVKSVVVSLRKQGFVDYLYYTDYETLDPTFLGLTPSQCAIYGWQTNPSRPAACTSVAFASSDVLDGPVHSNDVIHTCGTTFNATVTTADPVAPYYTENSGCGGSTFRSKGQPVTGPTHVSRLDLPPTNTSMKTQTRSDLVAHPGCLYTGPTVVKYLGDGTMTVWSPWTQYTHTSGQSPTATGSNDAAECGAPGTATGQLGSSGGATVPELGANLLYVQTVPTDTADPNYRTTKAPFPSGVSCLSSDGNNSASDAASSVGWRFGTFSFPLRDSRTEAAPDGWDAATGLVGNKARNWSPNSWSTALPAYSCRAGDLFVSGTYTTQTTAASDDYVYITGDLKAASLSQDVLGLVGQNAVLVWNPVDSTGKALLTDTGREIDAAILSVAHTFQVQNYNISGTRGVLTVDGAVAQRYRGAVGTGSGGGISTGYSKHYLYDQLLGTVAPPYFLAPSGVTFRPTLYASTPPAFDASGAAR